MELIVVNKDFCSGFLFLEDWPEENLVSMASAPLTQSSLFFLTRKLV